MNYIARIDPQRMPFFAGALILLVVALLFAGLILPQYKVQRAASHDLSRLQQTVQVAPSVAAEQARLQADVERLELEIQNDVNGMPQHALETFVTGRVQSISWRREMELMAIQASPGARIGDVQETLFQLELSGEYDDLHDWLRNIRVELDFATVRQLALAPLESQHSEPRLRAQIVLAAYSSTQ
jgi:acylphosphatase